MTFRTTSNRNAQLSHNFLVLGPYDLGLTVKLIVLVLDVNPLEKYFLDL
jgi:hypothetical protein